MSAAALWSCWWSSLLWPQTHITYFRTAPNVGFCPRSLMSIFLHTEGDQILPPNLGDSVVNAQLWLLINCWEPHSIQFKETAQERKHKPKSWTYLLSYEALALDYLRAIVWTRSRLWHKLMTLPVPFSSLCGEEAEGRAAHSLHKLWQVRFACSRFHIGFADELINTLTVHPCLQ